VYVCVFSLCVLLYQPCSVIYFFYTLAHFFIRSLLIIHATTIQLPFFLFNSFSSLVAFIFCSILFHLLVCVQYIQT
jgi:hypothetical protein